MNYNKLVISRTKIGHDFSIGVAWPSTPVQLQHIRIRVAYL